MFAKSVHRSLGVKTHFYAWRTLIPWKTVKFVKQIVAGHKSLRIWYSRYFPGLSKYWRKLKSLVLGFPTLMCHSCTTPNTPKSCSYNLDVVVALVIRLVILKAVGITSNTDRTQKYHVHCTSSFVSAKEFQVSCVCLWVKRSLFFHRQEQRTNHVRPAISKHWRDLPWFVV